MSDTCPTCGSPTDTQALAFLHEQVCCRHHNISTNAIAELLQTYADQAVAIEHERLRGALMAQANIIGMYFDQLRRTEALENVLRDIADYQSQLGQSWQEAFLRLRQIASDALNSSVHIDK